MKFLVCLATLALIATLAQGSVEQEWANFKLLHRKRYLNIVEEQKRLSIFKDNLKKIEENNKKFEQGLIKYKFGITKFADLTEEEFKERLGLNNYIKPRRIGNKLFQKPENVQLESQVDWRSKGVVTAVKDQGSCGSCWSFSATGSLEGQNALLNNVSLPLSEQNLVDCSRKYGNEGCNGGLMTSAFEYVRDNGITSEDKYPYEGRDKDCRFTPEDKVLGLTGYTDIAQGDEEGLLAAVATIGPVSVAIDATLNLQLYKYGILDDEYCNAAMLNHGVLAVGYGTDEKGNDFWLVKNSWGTNWGENGYFRYPRNVNACGIAEMCTYPNL